MCLCGIGLGLTLLYVGNFAAFGQVEGPPPPPITVQFSSDNYTVAAGDTASITVTLSDSSADTITVGYTTSDGTGQSGVDYTTASGTLTFPPGTVSQDFSVPTMNSSNNTSAVTVNLALSSPSNATLGSPSIATLYVVNSSSCQQ